MSEPTHYQRKPEALDAMIFDGTRESANDIIAWLEPYGFAIAYKPGDPGTNSAALPARPAALVVAEGPDRGRAVAGEWVVHFPESDTWSFGEPVSLFIDYDVVTDGSSPIPQPVLDGLLAAQDRSQRQADAGLATAPPPPIAPSMQTFPPALDDLPAPETGFPDDPPLPPPLPNFAASDPEADPEPAEG